MTDLACTFRDVYIMVKRKKCYWFRKEIKGFCY